MSSKRVTIYDLAKALDISVSYVSKALTGHPTISDKMKKLVRAKALALNYRHNSHAANLRKGRSKTLGVIVPHVDKRFFSEAIAGIEEVCFENGHSLIICQSHDSFKKECSAIDTLIRQNVDGILISVAAETLSSTHLENIKSHGIELVQFDRYIEPLNASRILNNNEQAAIEVVMNLITQGYKRIAFIGGPPHSAIFELRKNGYLKALKKAGIKTVPELMANDSELSAENAKQIATKMLASSTPPDAFFTVSDHQAFGAILAIEAFNLNVPRQVGIFGFGDETFSGMIRPSLSSVDQKSRLLGITAAKLYFDLLNTASDIQTKSKIKTKIVKAQLIVRQSSSNTV